MKEKSVSVYWKYFSFMLIITIFGLSLISFTEKKQINVLRAETEGWVTLESASLEEMWQYPFCRQWVDMNESVIFKVDCQKGVE